MEYQAKFAELRKLAESALKECLDNNKRYCMTSSVRISEVGVARSEYGDTTYYVMIDEASCEELRKDVGDLIKQNGFTEQFEVNAEW